MIPTPRHILGFKDSHLLVTTGDITLQSLLGASLGFQVACLFDSIAESRPGARPSRVRLDLPLAQALDLCPGSIVHPDGDVSWDSRVSRHVIRIDTREARLERRQTLVDEGYLPPNFEMVGNEPTVGEARWVIAPTFDGGSWVITPAQSIFAAYYAPNSKLATDFLSGGILDILEALSADRRNSLSNGVAHLHFGQGRLVSEVRTLGRLLFDPVARGRAEDFVSVNMEATRSNRPLSLECEFPFAGITDLEVQGVARIAAVDGRRVILAFNIMSCSHPFPFASVEARFESPSSGGSEDGEAGGGRRAGRVHEDFTDEFIPLDPKAQVPARQVPTIAALRRGTTFTALPGSSVYIRRPTRQRKRGRGPGIQPATGVSPHAPAGNGDSNLRNVVTATPGDANQDEDATLDRSTLGPAPALQMVRQTLEELHSLDHVNHVFADVSGALIQLGPLVLNAAQSHGRSKMWPFICSGAQPRCILVARLSKDQAHIALFEILRNPGESFSMLAAFRNDRSLLLDEDLNAVYRLICVAEGLPKDAELRKTTGLEVRRVYHHSVNAMRNVVLECLTQPPGNCKNQRA